MLNSDRHFEKWYEYYKEELIQMYYEVMSLVEKHNNVNIESDNNFNLFINFIYDSSSKYISKDM